jgi:hypothetical protein
MSGVLLEKDIDGSIERLAARGERALRHAEAARNSDFTFLLSCLQDASRRFSDIADLLERDGQDKHVGFLRASAARYKRAAEELG